MSYNGNVIADIEIIYDEDGHTYTVHDRLTDERFQYVTHVVMLNRVSLLIERNLRIKVGE